MHKKLRIVLVGHGVLTHALLCALSVNAQCKVVAVYLWSARPRASAASKRYDQPTRRLARGKGITRLRCNSINDREFAKGLDDLNADCVLIGSWGEKLTTVLDTQGVLFVNCHPSLLPAHRGANPYFATILAGDTESGVSFHFIDEDYDTGAVILQKKLIVNDTDTGYTLRQRCSELAASMVDQLIDKLSDPDLIDVIAQSDLGEPSYSCHVTLEDAQIDLNDDAVTIHRRIRAVMPWRQANIVINRMCRLVIGVAQLRPAQDNSSRHGSIVEIANDIMWFNAGDQDIGFKQPQLTVLGIILPWSWSKRLMRCIW